MIRNVIFDVDGTLWDSARQVTAAWQEVLDRHPETKDVKITVDDMYRYMGHTMYEISCMMLPDISEDGNRCHIHTAAAQNVAGRQRFDLFKSIAK